MKGEADNETCAGPTMWPGNEGTAGITGRRHGSRLRGVHHMAQSRHRHSHPDRRATLGAALIERAAFWYQLLVLKSRTGCTVLRLRTLLETDRFTVRLALCTL